MSADEIRLQKGLAMLDRSEAQTAVTNARAACEGFRNKMNLFNEAMRSDPSKITTFPQQHYVDLMNEIYALASTLKGEQDRLTEASERCAHFGI